MRPTQAKTLSLPVVLALCAVLCLGTARPARAATTAPLKAPSGWFKGANLTSWWYDEWQSPSTNQAIQALRGTNSSDAMFIVTWYMGAKTSSRVAPDPYKTPSDAGLLRAMAFAKSQGMRVELKLHVDVLDGTFRANIRPTSVGMWFQSYRAMVVHYAQLAQQAGASLLVIGTELTSMSVHPGPWRSLIATARSLFSGQLTFAANWVTGAAHIKFWDALDYIGVDAYMPLSTSANPDPSVPQLAQSWGRYVTGLGRVVSTFRKPAIFTEIGYQSTVGTAVTPWYTAGATSQTAQANAYEAFYEVWSKVPWFRGVFWWDWRPSYNALDGDFNPQGKPAQATMTAWN